MSTIRLYGVPASRAMRCLWALEEVGASYELVPTNFSEDVRAPEFLKINPNGRIPALVDGELVLFESMAINLHLARSYGGALYPADAAAEARTWQWSFWGMTEIEPHLITLLLHQAILPEAQRQPELATQAGEALERPLRVLDAQLGARTHLLGDAFTIADLNVASVLAMKSPAQYEGVEKFKNVTRWFDACTARPTFARAIKAGR